MTTRRKTLDNTALQNAIERRRQTEDAREILTRSEQKLAAQKAEAVDMQRQLRVLARDRDALRRNIADLQKLLDQVEANHRDMLADLRSTLQSIHQLEMDGISLGFAEDTP